MRLLIAMLVTVLLAGGCTSPTRGTYGSRDVGAVIETTEGTVLSSRIVEVSGESTLAGPAVGGASGAVLGGAGIGSGSGSTIAAVLGGLLGAGTGYLAEKRFKSGEGIEYVLRMDDGRTVSVVQNRDPDEEPLPEGTPVLVQIGSRYSRVIESPSADADAFGGDWIDPDSLGPTRLPPEADEPAAVPPTGSAQQ